MVCGIGWVIQYSFAIFLLLKPVNSYKTDQRISGLLLHDLCHLSKIDDIHGVKLHSFKLFAKMTADKF